MFRKLDLLLPRREKKKSKASGRRPWRNFVPRIELLESRDLPSAGVFLQGTAFVDLNHDHTLDQKDPYLPGATVSLYQGSGATGTPIATTVTNSQGAYLFSDANVGNSYGNPGLNPGIYTLQESAAGYANSGTQYLSQLDPVVSSTASTITVNVLDPTNMALAFDVNQFFGRNAWDYLQQSLQFTGSGVTNGSPVVTMSSTNGLATGQSVTVVQGSTTLNSTISAITPNVSITLANNWTGTTGTAATVTDTETETAGQFPVQLVNPNGSTLSFSGAGVTHNSATISMTNTTGLTTGEFVKITDGTTTLYSLITKVTANSSITLDDQWPGATGHTATVSVLSTYDPAFLTLCWDLANEINDSFSPPPVAVTNVFDVVPTPGQGTPPNAGQIAYLFNHYGTIDITSASADAAALAGANATVPSLAKGSIAEAVGLQIAIWELEYGTTFVNLQVLTRLSNGNSGVTAQELSDIKTWAAFYISDSAGKDETATFLVANGVVQLGQQGMIASGSFNFGNTGSPAITTSPSPTSVTLGTTSVTLKDTAVLSGGYNPTGTITFTLYQGNTLVDTETIGISGDGSYTTPTGYTLPTSGTVTGTYQWDAAYTGDTNNISTSDVNNPSEQVMVSPGSPSIATSPSSTSVTLPGRVIASDPPTLKDSALLSGGYDEIGTITFTLYYNGGSSPVDTESVSVHGNGTYTTPIGYTLPSSGTVTGTYQWDASYSGDGNNLSTSDNNNPNEQVTVSPASPSITTLPSPTSVTLGTGSVTLNDSAVLSGGYNETGTITFTLYLGNTLVDTEAVGVNGDGTYTTPTGYVLPTNGTTTGTYQWDASYTGDGNNNSTSDNNNSNEQVTVSPASPNITTTPSITAVTLGTTSVTLTDTAVLSGGYNPTGTITFTLYLGSTLVDTETVSVSGDSSYTTPTGFTLPTSGTVTGTYQWDASYTGDGNNNSTSDNNNSNEQVTVSPASPNITTTPSITAVTLGTTSVTLTDTAALSGGYNETGTITFTLYYNGGSSPVDTESVSVHGNGNYTTPTGYTLPNSGAVTGTYQWDASYSGDTNNNSTSDSNNSNEQVTVSPASPSITTTPNITAVTLGTTSVTLTDTAVLSGGYGPTGTITFTLYLGNTLVDTETVSVSGDSSYTTPTGYTLPTSGTVTGTYQWDATYSGDTNNNGTSDNNNSNEQVTVSPASPNITTTPSPTSVTLGTTSVTLTDTAALSGGYNETGTITFTLYYNGGSSPVDTESVSVYGNGNYTTPTGYTLPNSGTVTGNYQWDASYSGDTNNSSTSDNNDSREQVTVSPASPSITTTPSITAVTLGTTSVTLTDTAVLSGGYGPTGTITFTLYLGSTLVDTETVSVSGDSSYTTPTGYTLPTSGTATGTYQWDASYSGDTNNNGTSDNNNSNEQVTVSPASPNITTTPSPTSVTLGTSSVTLTDTAALSGGYNETGTITFTLYYNGGSSPVDTESVSVHGNGNYTTPTGYTLPTSGTVTGNYQWDASYSGDTNNNSTSDNNDSREQVTVSPASPSITTTPSITAVTLGTTSVTLKDTAVLSGGYSPTGTITFTLYLGSTLVDTETVGVNGDSSYTTPTGYTLPTSGTATGTYQWDTSYSGDTNNNGTSDNNNSNEQVTVSPASPNITTTPSPTSVTLGTTSVTLTDTAVLSGGYNETGTITFTLYYNGGSSPVDTESVSVHGNGNYTTPTGYTLPTSGTVTGNYQWDASYSGDTNNNSTSDNNDSREQVTVSPASPSITTTPSPTSVTLGTSSVTLTDTAVLSGGYNETGTITFTLYYNGGSSPVDTESVSVHGNGNYTTPTGYTLPTSGTATGNYQWDASYTGDTNNNSTSDNNDSREQVTVSPASPSITTTPSITAVTLGTTSVTLKDTAVLSGGYSPTGTITFTLYLGSTLVDTETVSVSGDSSYTTPTGYTLPTSGTVTGTYQWDATYSGDTNNSSASDNNDSREQVTVSTASPNITTTPSPTSVTLGTSSVTLTDTAVLAGGYNETGTITFTLYYNGGSSPVDTESVSVHGNGTYTTPTGYTLSSSSKMTGTYQWDATYTGDSNNNGTSDNNDSREQVTVSPAGPSITTTPSATAVTLGTSSVTLTDTALLSGGFSPTGTITFTLYYNGGSSPVDTETVSVHGNGSYTTPTGYTVPTPGTVTGTYQWDASYSGDTNNSSASDNNDSREQVSVTKASPSIVTTPSPTNVTLGSSSVTLTDSAVISGGYNETGTITFTLYYNGGSSPVDTETVGVHGNGTYTTPTGYALPATGTVTGTYQWDASYTGDGNNNSSSDNNDSREQVTVGPVPSPGLSLTTTPSPTSVTLTTSSVTLKDSAVLSGAFNPTGTITFTLYYNGGSSAVDTESIAVHGNGTYTTPTGYTTPASGTVTGTYQWDATYSGDTNNASASDNNDSREQVTVSKASPSIVTTPSPTSVTLGTSSVTLTDSAVLSNGYNETGTITFTLYYNGGSSPVDTESVAVHGNGTYTTPTGYTLPTSGTVTGSYQWDASYTGDGNNLSSSDNNDSREKVTVASASPSITTTPSVTSVTLGTTSVTLKDTAVLAGGYNPTGTITFTLYLGSTLVDTETIAVSGDGGYTTPTGYTLPTTGTVTGTYQWDATYSGNGNNISASDNNDSREQVTVTKGSPAISTTPSPTSVTLGTSSITLTDSAVLSNGYNETGTITFTLYYNGGSSPVDTESVSVHGNGTYSTPTGYTLPTSGTVTGTYQWDATYFGDGNNLSATDINDSREKVTVSSASPSIVTTPSATGVTLGTTSVTLKDTAVLSGGYDETGTITFTLYLGSTLVDTETIAVSGNGSYTTPTGYTLPTTGTVTGTYQWDATYSGNGNNISASDNNDSREQVTVSKGSPAIATTPNITSVTLGTSSVTLKDTAVLSGGYSETGTITFTLYKGSTLLDTETVAVNGNGSYTTPTGYTLPTSGTVTGTYQWDASYTGNGNNLSASDVNDSKEQVVVSPAGPSISTTPGGTIGISSNISISGTKFLDMTGNGFSSDDTPQSGVTIDLYNSTAGLGTNSGYYQQTTTASNGTYSFINLSPGTYYVQEVVPSGYIQTGGGPIGSADNTYYTIVATAGHGYFGYNFDDYLIPACQPTSVTYTVTTPSGSSQTFSTLTGNTQQGDKVTVTFTTTMANEQLTLVSYFAPGSSFSDSTAYQQQIYQAATQTYVTPGTYTLGPVTIPSCYYQIDFACGPTINQLEPSQNNDAYGPDAAEILYHAEGRYISSDNEGTTAPSTSSLNSTTPTLPTLTTAASATATLTDSATLSGAYNPTGTVTFYLLPPGSTSSTPLSSAIYSDAVPITGNATYSSTSAGITTGNPMPTQAGTYEWVVIYSGDGNNRGATSPFGTEPESVTGAPQVTVTKTADCADIAPGQTAGYTVTITNSGTATATGVTLSDPMPAGKGNDIKWAVDTTEDNPTDFVISGSVGSQSLALSSSFLGSDSLAAGQSISVHITAATYADDVTSSCTAQCTIPCNFNGTPIPGGDYIWFNCAISCQGLSSSHADTVCFTGQTISFTCGGQNYNVAVPNGCVTFSPNCTSATTTFNTSSGSWVTCEPEGLSGNEFICGVPLQVPSGGLAGGIQNVTWTGTCSDDDNVTCNYQWAAACYTNFSSNCAYLQIKPCDSNTASGYKDSDHCGSPENFCTYVTGGACGGGGSNYTGSYSGTCSVTCNCESGGSGTLTNIATVGATGQASVSASASITITTSVPPQVTVTKTADSTTIQAGQTAGYTVTLTNTSQTTTANQVTLSDPLPAGLGNDVLWSIDTSKGTPSDFQITGSEGSQDLTLISGLNTLAAGQSISVHITAATYADDVASACTSQCSIPCNFNGTPIPGGDYIWFNCALNCQGLSTSQNDTICLTGQSISFTCGGQSYNVAVPNGCVTFSPSCTTATTTFGATGTWITCEPEGLPGNEFICGVPFLVPSGGLSGGIQNVTWTGTCSAANNITCDFQWAAACYSIFTGNCSSLNIKPCDSNQASQYKDSDHCGSPENFCSYVTGGACGGGGSNYTGSYSGTCSVTPSSGCGGTGTLYNVATVTAMCQSSVCASATITIQTAPITISGTKYCDTTGNGFSSDDVGQGGVTIDLYRQTGSGGATLVGTTTTASTGNYSFGNLVPGTYYVQEVVPSGYIQTGGGPNGSAGATYYTIAAQSGQSYGGNNFDDYLVPSCQPKSYSFAVNNNGTVTNVSGLQGATKQGETVTVTFSTGSMSDQLSLVSYVAPSSTFSSSNAYQQQIFDLASGTFAANGTYSLTVLIPNCYYQIDFICGPAINVLGPQTYNGNPYGPDSSNILYSAEDRLLSSDNGGTQAFSATSVSAGDFGTTALWTSTNGKNLLDKLNGSSTATQLAQWLASSFPNLYGSGAGAHSLVNSNGTFFTNAQVVSAYSSKFTGGDQQVLSAALSVYATSVEFAGSTAAAYAKSPVGLVTSAYGSGMFSAGVGSNGAAFGVASSTALTVMQLLVDLNANTTAGASVSAGANTVFTSINSTGNVQNAILGNASLAYTPAQIRSAYGIDNLSLDGTGQTIAVVDAYNTPNILQDVDTFDSQFGLTSTGPTLYSQYGSASSFLTVVGQNGSATLPATDPTGGWEMETALDVEWLHAIAPGAHIDLVEANSQSLSDLMASVATAADLPGVSVVSMSWGLTEGQSVLAADEARYDADLTTPDGHQGVTFVASTGDNGSADPEYPAFSPNVLAVGGTSLYLGANGSYGSETGWGGTSTGGGSSSGSGGGISQFESAPAYQLGVQSTGRRTDPDVAFVADPSTGVWIADTYNLPASDPWEVAGGTSVGAPAWAGLIALVNQGRTEAGESTLDSGSPNQTQQALYSLPVSDFHQVVGGSNGGFTATAGYNLVTGLGSPVANVLVPNLISYSNGAGNFTPAAHTPVDFTSAVTGKPRAVSGLRVYDALTRSDSVAGGNGSALLAGTSASGANNVAVSACPARYGLPITSYLSSPAASILQGVTATGSGAAFEANGLAASERVWLDWSAQSNGLPSSLDDGETSSWLQVVDPDLVSAGPMEVPSLLESGGQGSEVGEVIVSEPVQSDLASAERAADRTAEKTTPAGSAPFLALQALAGWMMQPFSGKTETDSRKPLKSRARSKR